MILERNQSYKGDCVELMKFLPDESIDVILTDPPYLYLKNQKLDRPFDETEYFKQVKRILKKDGFVVLFGRGTSFYRWNTILGDLGFTFKEEIIWDKSYCSSPLIAISRVHETVSIHTKGNGIIRKAKIPYIEAKIDNFEAIHNDLKRIKSALNNPKELTAINEYIEKRIVVYGDNKKRKNNTTIQGVLRGQHRSVKTLQSITEGMNEKSIIRQPREHYKTIHPTQKPPRLLERLLALVCKPGALVLDTFRGPGSTDIACINFGCDYISIEIDDEYFDLGNKRVSEYKRQLKSQLFKNAQ